MMSRAFNASTNDVSPEQSPFSPSLNQSPVFTHFALQGIPIHPDHCLDPTMFGASETLPEEIISCSRMEEDDDNAVPAADELTSADFDSPILSLNHPRNYSLASSTSSSSSSSSASCFDYFSIQSPAMTEHTPPSSGASTPTDSSSCPKITFSPTLLSSSYSPVYGLWSSASPFCPPALPSPRTEKASRRSQHPYARPATPDVPAAAAAMQRSYSMPAETQQQVEDRLSHRAHLLSVIAVQAAPSMVRESPDNRLPLQAAFGAGWGSALPLRSPAMPSATENLPYPYNLARYGPTSPTQPRFARSYSTTDIPTVYCPVDGSSIFAATSKQPMTPAQRARKVLGPMTPILASAGTLEAAPRLNRGMSF